ncbi:hypothetical protein, partial [Pseudomonas sp. EL_65y_Pfl2_R96]|uniref:hypothetical protein n=1 Tax=Pseudomonas sp. EL_65y_Pfl2_R96 TaxID=3088699 RepID=UPI0030DC298F
EGSFDIPASVVPQDRAYTVTVGVRYTAAVVTLPPELKSQTGTSQGVRQRIVRLALRLIETAGLKIGVQGGKLDNLIDRPSAGYMDAPVPLFTGDTERPVSGGWDRSGRATFRSSEPLPAVIVAALPKIEVTG